MIFYHNTTHESIAAILDEGLSKGDVILSYPDNIIDGVWLTSDPDPSGHGLTDGSVVTEEVSKFMEREYGDPYPVGMLLSNKREVQIKLEVDESDPKLVRWIDWAQTRVGQKWISLLKRTGGGKHETWFVYFGIIPPETFAGVRLSGDPKQSIFAMS